VSINLVQSNVAFTSTGTTLTCAFASSNRPGNCLVVSTANYTNFETSTVSDTNGNVWKSAIILSNPPVGTAHTYKIWYAANCVGGGTNTITVTHATTGKCQLHISEWSGIDPTNPLDQVSSATGSSTPAVSKAIATVSDGDLLYSYIDSTTALTGTGTGWTQLTTTDTGTTAYRILPTAGNAQTAWVTNTGVWGTALVAFRPAAPKTAYRPLSREFGFFERGEYHVATPEYSYLTNATPYQLPPSVLQTWGANSSSATASLSALSSNNVSATPSVIAIAVSASGNQSFKVTDDLGYTYYRFAPVYNATLNQTMQMFYAWNTGTNNDVQVTVTTATAASNFRIHAHEIANVGSFGEYRFKTGSSGNLFTDPHTPSVAGEFILGYGLTAGGTSSSADSPWVTTNTQLGQSTESFVTVDTGQISPSYTGDGGAWICGMIAFLPEIQDRTISIDFVGTGTAMASTESAGVVPKTNWNSLSGAKASTITCVQANDNGAGAAANTLTCAYASSVTAGNTLMAAVIGFTPTTDFSITDNQGNVWSSVGAGPYFTYDNNVVVQFFYATNVKGGATTLTATVASGQSDFINIGILEYSGLNGKLDVANVVFNSGTGTSITASTYTTKPNDLVVALAVQTDNHTISASSGFAIQSTIFEGNLQDQVVATPQTINFAASFTPSALWGCLVAVFTSTSPTLVDETGRATDAYITWRSSTTFATGITDTAGDNRMMKGYLDNQDQGSIYVGINNLPVTPYGWDVYIYTDGDNASATRTASYSVDNGTTVYSASVSDTATNFGGSYVQGINSSTGNYVKLGGVIGSALIVKSTPLTTSDAVLRAPINGIQLVPTKAALGAVQATAASTATLTAQLLASGHVQGTFTWAGQSSSTLTGDLLVSAGGGYTYARTITIDHTKVSTSTHTNFPVLITGTYSYLATVANGGRLQSTSGYDFALYADSAATTLLDFERVSWSATTGAVELHVRIPSLSSSADTVIYLLYGNSSITTDQQNKTGVWDSNTLFVAHASDTPVNGGNITDSTSNAKHALISANGSVAGSTITKTTGAWSTGSSVTFASQNEYNSYVAGTASDIGFSTGNSTLSLWVNNTGSYTGFDTYVTLLGTEGGSYPNHFDELVIMQDGTIKLRIGTEGEFSAATSAISANTWYHVAATYNGTTALVYINGAQVVSTTLNRGTLSAVMVLGVGGFSGSLDELKAAKVVRSGGWIATEYNNQSSPATFYAVGSEQQSATTNGTASWLGLSTSTLSAISAGVGTTNWTGTSSKTLNAIVPGTASWTTSTSTATLNAISARVATLALTGTSSATLNAIVPATETLAGTSSATINAISGMVATQSLAGTSSATLNAIVPATASFAGTSTATLNAISGMVATLALTGTSTATLNAIIPATASLSGTSSATESAISGAVATQSLAGTSSSTLSAIGGAVATQALSGSSTATLSAIAGAIATQALAGTSSATLNAISGIVATQSLVATSTATLNAIIAATAAFAGTSTASQNAISGIVATQSLVATSTATLNAISGAVATQALVASSSATLNAIGGVVATQALIGTSSSTLNAIAGAVATQSLVATSTATLNAIIPATAAFSGTSSATQNAIAGAVATQSFAGTSTATLNAVIPATATFSGTSSATENAISGSAATQALTGISTSTLNAISAVVATQALCGYFDRSAECRHPGDGNLIRYFLRNGKCRIRRCSHPGACRYFDRNAECRYCDNGNMDGDIQFYPEWRVGDARHAITHRDFDCNVQCDSSGLPHMGGNFVNRNGDWGFGSHRDTKPRGYIDGHTECSSSSVHHLGRNVISHPKRKYGECCHAIASRRIHINLECHFRTRSDTIACRNFVLNVVCDTPRLGLLGWHLGRHAKRGLWAGCHAVACWYIIGNVQCGCAGNGVLVVRFK
jgi:hypothetical protein